MFSSARNDNIIVGIRYRNTSNNSKRHPLKNEQQIKVISQLRSNQTNMPRGQQSSKLLGQKPSRRKNKASDQREQQTEQDGPNVFPNLRETNQTDNRNRTDSAAAELFKRDLNNNNSKPDERKPILIIGS